MGGPSQDLHVPRPEFSPHWDWVIFGSDVTRISHEAINARGLSKPQGATVTKKDKDRAALNAPASVCECGQSRQELCSELRSSQSRDGQLVLCCIHSFVHSFIHSLTHSLLHPANTGLWPTPWLLPLQYPNLNLQIPGPSAEAMKHKLSLMLKCMNQGPLHTAGARSISAESNLHS